MDDWFVSVPVPGVISFCLLVYRYMDDWFVSLPVPGLVPSCLLVYRYMAVKLFLYLFQLFFSSVYLCISWFVSLPVIPFCLLVYRYMLDWFGSLPVPGIVPLWLVIYHYMADRFLLSSCRSPVGHTVSPVFKTKCAVLFSSSCGPYSLTCSGVSIVQTVCLRLL